MSKAPTQDAAGRSRTGRPMKAALIPKGAQARREAAEDYALRKVPAHWKRPAFSFAMSLSGLTSRFLARRRRYLRSRGPLKTSTSRMVATSQGTLGP